jgi:glyoxylase-like metal-dependent hydrolase (beta-lactamase superfamily II)
MTTSYDFCCGTPGCKVHVHVIMHMHDDHVWDLDQLGKALGFTRVGSEFTITTHPWQCVAHEASDGAHSLVNAVAIVANGGPFQVLSPPHRVEGCETISEDIYIVREGDLPRALKYKKGEL